MSAHVVGKYIHEKTQLHRTTNMGDSLIQVHPGFANRREYLRAEIQIAPEDLIKILEIFPQTKDIANKLQEEIFKYEEWLLENV